MKDERGASIMTRRMKTPITMKSEVRMKRSDSEEGVVFEDVFGVVVVVDDDIFVVL